MNTIELIKLILASAMLIASMITTAIVWKNYNSVKEFFIAFFSNPIFLIGLTLGTIGLLI